MKINEDHVPSTIEEAIEILYSGLSDGEIEEIKLSDPNSHHFSIGRYLRNSWSFWEDTPLKRDFIARFKLFGHADDISGALLEGLFVKCRGGDVEQAILKAAEKYRKHWVKYGVNPETGKMEGIIGEL